MNEEYMKANERLHQTIQERFLMLEEIIMKTKEISDLKIEALELRIAELEK